MIYEPPQWLFWLLLTFGFAIDVILAYHEVRRQKVSLERQLDDKTKKREIRKVLAEFLSEGNQLAIIDQSKAPPNQEVADWAKRVANYLEENLGKDYVASFFDCGFICIWLLI